jgi:hypothetical protein
VVAVPRLRPPAVLHVVLQVPAREEKINKLGCRKSLTEGVGAHECVTDDKSNKQLK